MYHSDYGHFPGQILHRDQAWSAATFFGGTSGGDTNAPPAESRPLRSYVTKGEVFHCPADVGIEVTNKWGVLLKPNLFEVWGVSYWYHAGRDGKQLPHSTRGLGDRTMEWVRRPSASMLSAEPPEVVVATRPGATGPMTVYWHRARRPGTGEPYADNERGPRVSPFLFVDGHVKFYDCSYNYSDEPTFPGEVEFEQ